MIQFLVDILGKSFLGKLKVILLLFRIAITLKTVRDDKKVENVYWRMVQFMQQLVVHLKKVNAGYRGKLDFIPCRWSFHMMLMVMLICMLLS